MQQRFKKEKLLPSIPQWQRSTTVAKQKGKRRREDVLSSHIRRPTFDGPLVCFRLAVPAMCTHTRTHTHTHARRGIDPRDEARFLSRELEKNGHRPLTFLETGVAASFMRSPPFPFQPCVHTAVLYRRPCIIDHLTSLSNSFTFPSTRTH